MTTPLYRIRQARQITLQTIAEATGIDTGNLSRLERGRQSASPLVAAKLAEFFDQSISELEILYPERYA